MQGSKGRRGRRGLLEGGRTTAAPAGQCASIETFCEAFMVSGLLLIPETKVRRPKADNFQGETYPATAVTVHAADGATAGGRGRGRSRNDRTRRTAIKRHVYTNVSCE